MNRIGLKSFSSCSLFLTLLLIGFQLGGFRFQRLQSLDPLVTFLIGFMAFLMGEWIFRFWKQGEKSQTQLGVFTREEPLRDEVVLFRFRSWFFMAGRNQGAFELSPFVQRGLWVLNSGLICLLAFNNHAVELIKSLPRRLQADEARICPKEETVPDLEKLEENTLKDPGCRLIFRAYKLGYKKDLGSCGVQDKKIPDKVCTRRQWDEPYLHYGWRQLDHFFNDLAKVTDEKWLASREKSFDVQMKNLSSLRESGKQVLTSLPRSLHVLWTNLPPPHGKIAQAFHDHLDPHYCVRKYSQMSHVPHPEGSDDSAIRSQKLDHVLGHLLFDPREPITVGFCQEYKIIWGASKDTCERLMQNPKKTVQAEGLSQETWNIIRRFHVRKDIRTLNEKLAELDTEKKDLHTLVTGTNGEHSTRIPPTVSRILSFQCLMVDEATEPNAQVLSDKVDLFGDSAEVRRVQITPKDFEGKVSVNLYKKVAQLFSKGFRYTGFESNEKFQAQKSFEVNPELFDVKVNPNYAWSRLHFLKETDIFLGHEWVQEREDLMEVYPYYHHLYHFVNLFRENYQVQRGRL